MCIDWPVGKLLGVAGCQSVKSDTKTIFKFHYNLASSWCPCKIQATVVTKLVREFTFFLQTGGCQGITSWSVGLWECGYVGSSHMTKKKKSGISKKSLNPQSLGYTPGYKISIWRPMNFFLRILLHRRRGVATEEEESVLNFVRCLVHSTQAFWNEYFQSCLCLFSHAKSKWLLKN